MSDVIEVETVEGDCRALLAEFARRQPLTWWTAREVHNSLGRWSHVAVRHALRDLATDGVIETRLTGTDARPLREYRGR